MPALRSAYDLFLADVQADQDKIAQIAFAKLRETDTSPMSWPPNSS
jgi:hypothetical protein